MASATQLYPWQNSIWQHLQQQRQQGRLHHALLFHGLSGVGKLAMARHFARSLLCLDVQSDGEPCGHCQPCGLIAAQTCPDYFEIKPVNESKEIRVDQIRALCSELRLTAQCADSRVVVIEDAQRMNLAASNSLLKTLEEPAGNVYLILTTSQTGWLLNTIISRCQKVPFGIPEADVAIDWLTAQGQLSPELALKLGMGAPLAAQNYTKKEDFEQRREQFNAFVDVVNHRSDPLVAAEQWSKSITPQLIGQIQSWIADMIRLKMGATEANELANTDFIDALRAMANQLDLKVLFQRLQKLDEVSRLMQNNINPQLLMEEVLLPWA